MLNKFSLNPDTIIIEKKSISNVSVEEINYSISYQNKVLIVDNIIDNKVNLKWVDLLEIDTFKQMLNNINDLEKDLNKTNEKILSLQHSNNELLFKLNHVNENILKVNEELLDEKKIDDILSFKIKMITEFFNKKIDEISDKFNIENTVKIEEVEPTIDISSSYNVISKSNVSSEESSLELVTKSDSSDEKKIKPKSKPRSKKIK